MSWQVHYCNYVRDTEVRSFLGNAIDKDHALSIVGLDAQTRHPRALFAQMDSNEFGHTTIHYDKSRRHYLLVPLN